MDEQDLYDAVGLSHRAAQCLEWCKQGDPEVRATALRTFLAVRVGQVDGPWRQELALQELLQETP